MTGMSDNPLPQTQALKNMLKNIMKRSSNATFFRTRPVQAGTCHENKNLEPKREVKENG